MGMPDEWKENKESSSPLSFSPSSAPLEFDLSSIPMEDSWAGQSSPQSLQNDEETMEFIPTPAPLDADLLEKTGSPKKSSILEDPGKTVPHKAVKKPQNLDVSKNDLSQIQSLADLLVEKGLVSKRQIQKAVAVQEQNPEKKLGPILIEMGFLKEEDLVETLAELYGIGRANLDMEIPDPHAVKLFSPAMVKKYKLVPLKIDSNRLVVAMSNPFDLGILKELEALVPMKIDPLFAPKEEIEKVLSTLYQKKQEKPKPFRLSSSKQSSKPAAMEDMEIAIPAEVDEKEDSVFELDEDDLVEEEVLEAELFEDEPAGVAEELLDFSTGPNLNDATKPRMAALDLPSPEPSPVGKKPLPSSLPGPVQNKSNETTNDLSKKVTKRESSLTLSKIKLPSPDTDLNILIPKSDEGGKGIPAEEICDEEFQSKWEKTPQGMFQSRLAHYLNNEVLEAEEVLEEEFRIACEGAC